MRQYQTRKTEVSPQSLAIQQKHSENVLTDLADHMQANTPPASNKFIQNFKTMMQPYSQSQVHQLVLQQSCQSQKSLSSTHVDDLILKIKKRANLETDYVQKHITDPEETANFLNLDSPSKEQAVSHYLDQQVSKYSAKNFFKKQPSTKQLDVQVTPQKQITYPIIVDELSDQLKDGSISARTPRQQSPSKQVTSGKKKVRRPIRSSMYLTHVTETKEKYAAQITHQPFYTKQILHSALVQKQKQKLRMSQNSSLQLQLNEFKQSVIQQFALDLVPSPQKNKINQPVKSSDQRRESSLQKSQQKSNIKMHTRQTSSTFDYFEKQPNTVEKNLEVFVHSTQLPEYSDHESKLPQKITSTRVKAESKTRKTKVAVKHSFKPALVPDCVQSNTLKTSCSTTIETLRPVASSLSNSSNHVLRNTINQLKQKEKLAVASQSLLQENLKFSVVEQAVKFQKKREVSKTKKKEKKQEEQKVLPLPSNTPPVLQKQQQAATLFNASNGWGMLDSEKLIFGDRCPKSYTKILLLGKGGIAVVWLATNELGEQVALKQFPKANSKSALDSSAAVEIEIARTMWESKCQVNESEFPGVRSIAKLLATIEDTKDNWLVYEVGSSPLSKHLFDVKGEFHKGERIYGVQHKSFYASLLHNKQALRDLIRFMAEVLDVLSYYSVVHADIKPDNILVDFDGHRIKNLKLIDFGSAFSYENPGNITASTPEYLAPEVLNYLENRGANTNHGNGTNSAKLCQMQEPWSYDVWSLGVILLELLTGIPIWMSLKCRTVTQTKKSQMATGIFAVQGRSGAKILLKQALVFKNLPQTLKKYECYGLNMDIQFMDLLQGMLEINPLKRISPKEVLRHPFVTQTS